MGGAQLSKPHLYCNGNYCDGFHPIDEGHEVIASTILPKIIEYYIKNPKGAKNVDEEQKQKDNKPKPNVPKDQFNDEELDSKIQDHKNKKTKSKGRSQREKRIWSIEILWTLKRRRSTSPSGKNIITVTGNVDLVRLT